MSAAARGLSTTVQGNSFFINITSFTPGVDSLDATGAVTAVTGLQGVQAAGALVLRDMGKTVRVPATSSSGSTQRILRKVQRFDGGADTTGSFPVTNGFVGFNEGVGGAADSSSNTGYETFYVELSGFNGSTTRFARLAF
jgi:hypothetical protein